MPNPLPESRTSATAAGEMVERRGSERIPFCVVGEVTDSASEMQLSVRIADINLQGCYVDSMHVFPAGTKVQVTIGRGSLEFKTPAIVVYSLAGLGMGLHFRAEPGEVQVWLKKWLAASEGPADKIAEEPVRAVSTGSEGQVLRTLVDLLMRRGVITVLEGGELLRKLPQK